MENESNLSLTSFVFQSYKNFSPFLTNSKKVLMYPYTSTIFLGPALCPLCQDK
jgi:hypothetical protein